MNESPWLLLDAHFNYGAYLTLTERGIRAVHAGEEGLASATAEQLIELALDDESVIVTRNAPDFERLAVAHTHAARPFPEVLVLADTIRPDDALAHVRAIEGWLAGRSDVATTDSGTGRLSWLR